MRSNSGWLIVIVLTIFLASSCQPNAQVLTIANPCSADLRVQVWDRPEPGDNDLDATTTTARAESGTRVPDAVTDLGEGGWSVVVLRSSAEPLTVPVPRTPDPVAVIPASACT